MFVADEKRMSCWLLVENLGVIKASEIRSWAPLPRNKYCLLFHAGSFPKTLKNYDFSFFSLVLVES
jgi:hypothetical protein